MRLPAGSINVTCHCDNPSRALMLFSSKETLQDCSHIGIWAAHSPGALQQISRATGCACNCILCCAFVYMTPLRIFVRLTQLFGTQNGAMHLSIAGRTVSRERHGCHDFTAQAQNSSCAWTSRCKTLAIAASSALKHAFVHCIAVITRRLIRKQVHRRRYFICFPIMAVNGHTIEAKVLGAANICCLGEDHASSPSRLHQRLKQLPQSAHKASEVVLPIQLIQVATQVLQRRTAPRHCTVNRTNSGFHTRFAGCTMPPSQQLHVQLRFNGRSLQSCILISVW